MRKIVGAAPAARPSADASRSGRTLDSPARVVRLGGAMSSCVGPGQGRCRLDCEGHDQSTHHAPLPRHATPSTRFFTSIADARILALDTEGASFHRFVDRIYLLQLSTRERHGDHRSGADRHARAASAGCSRIRRSRSCFTTPTTICGCCTRTTAGTLRTSSTHASRRSCSACERLGLPRCSSSYFGVKLDKKHQRADWSMRPLTQGMLDYAAQDTIHLLELRDQLEGRAGADAAGGLGAGRVRAARRHALERRGRRERLPPHQGRARSHATGARRSCASSCRGATRSPSARSRDVSCAGQRAAPRNRASSSPRRAKRSARSRACRAVFSIHAARVARRGEARARRSRSDLPRFQRRSAGIAIPTSTSGERAQDRARRRAPVSTSIPVCSARATDRSSGAQESFGSQRSSKVSRSCADGRRAARRGVRERARAASQDRAVEWIASATLVIVLSCQRYRPHVRSARAARFDPATRTAATRD